MRTLLILIVLVVISGIANAADLSGPFGWPLDPLQYSQEDHHLAYYPEYGGYHAGEDWNKNSGDDRGKTIYAIADGEVVYTQTSATAVSGKGRIVILRHTLPGGEQFDSAYIHCDSIKVKKGAVVEQGDPIATIGSTGTSNSHLHIEIQADLSLPIATNPYYEGTNSSTGKPRESLTPQNALRYVSPSLFIDDHTGGIITVDLTRGTWKLFEVTEHTPSVNVYLTDLLYGERHSIEEAVDDGHIAYGIVYKGTDGRWYYMSDPMAITLEPGAQYAIYARDYWIELNVLYPGFNYPDDRAQQDIIATVASDAHYVKVKPDTLVRRSEYDSMTWEFRGMETLFRTNNGKVWRAHILHATNVRNPLKRAVRIFDPNTWTWEDWQFLSPNELY